MKKFILFILLLVASQLVSYAQVFEKPGAGVTIIVHGWNPDGDQLAWMQSMAICRLYVQTGNWTVRKYHTDLLLGCNAEKFEQERL